MKNIPTNSGKKNNFKLEEEGIEPKKVKQRRFQSSFETLYNTEDYKNIPNKFKIENIWKIKIIDKESLTFVSGMIACCYIGRVAKIPIYSFLYIFQNLFEII